MSLWKLNYAEPNAEPTHQGLAPAQTASVQANVSLGIGTDHCLPPYYKVQEPHWVWMDDVLHPVTGQPVEVHGGQQERILYRFLYEPGERRFYRADGADRHPGIESFNILLGDNLFRRSVIYWSDQFSDPVWRNSVDPTVPPDPILYRWYLAFDLVEVSHTGVGGLPQPDWVLFIGFDGFFPRGTTGGLSHYPVWTGGHFGYKNTFNPLGRNSFPDFHLETGTVLDDNPPDHITILSSPFIEPWWP